MENSVMEYSAFGILIWFALQAIYFQKMATSED